jgi:hypothetical protein
LCLGGCVSAATKFSVVDVALATPNKFSCLLAPAGSPNLLSVDIIALARRQENNEKTFDCSEVVRQIVAPANQNKPLYYRHVEEDGGSKDKQKSKPSATPSRDISCMLYATFMISEMADWFASRVSLSAKDWTADLQSEPLGSCFK